MDETVPLLHEVHPSLDAGDKTIVTFDGAEDSEDPVNWSKGYKWSIVALLAFTHFNVTFNAVGLTPVANHIAADLNNGQIDSSFRVLIVTVWELGEAAGPLLIAPLSETFGRYAVINVANGLFILATILAAVCQTPSFFLFARVLTGLCVTSNVLNPAVMGDMFISEHRGSAMSVVGLAPLLGGAVGPAVAGLVTERLGWRSVLWLAATMTTICELIFFTCCHETYAVTILRRKAARLRAQTGNQKLKTEYDMGEDQRPARKFLISIARPFIVFYGSGVLQLVCAVGSPVLAYYYVMSTSLPEILQNIYGLSDALTGLGFLPFSIGSLMSIVTCNLLLDRIYVYLRKRRSMSSIEHGNGPTASAGQPEFRLPLIIVGSFALPPCIVLYGVSASLHLPIAILIVSLILMGYFTCMAYFPLNTYLVDATGPRYAASAMAALIIARCLVSTFLPLLTTPLVENFGYGWAFTGLASPMVIAAPMMVVLYFFGEKWRARSKYTQSVEGS